MKSSGESIRVMHPLFQEGQGGSIPTSPLSMRVDQVQMVTAMKLNRLWHSRLPAIGFGSINLSPRTMSLAFPCFAAHHSGTIYAVAIWSNPVARLLPQKAWLELRRFAIGPDAPRHTGSWMLGVMARLVRQLRPEVEVLMSYQDTEAHQGTIYRAAGWMPTATKRAGTDWLTPARNRPASQTLAAKQRWEKRITAPSACSSPGEVQE